MQIALPNRERWVKFLCERFGIDGSAAWKSWLGNGETTGVFLRAQWHFSMHGVKELPRTKSACHAPESPHQEAWLATWFEIRRVSSHSSVCRLMEIYLSALSGTGTVERFIHLKGDLAHSRPNLSTRNLEISLKLLVQDDGGRRRSRLDAESLLCKPTSAKTAGGATVVHPASQVLLRAQRLYAAYFGEKPGKARDMEAHSPTSLSRQRLLAQKPRLTIFKEKSDKSEKATLEKHAASCAAAASKVREGGVMEGVLGDIPSSAAGASESGILNSMAQAAWHMRKERKAFVQEASERVSWRSAFFPPCSGVAHVFSPLGPCV